jgi:anti-anti-sigma factor
MVLDHDVTEPEKALTEIEPLRTRLHRVSEGTSVCALGGEIDVACIARFHDAIEQAADNADTVVLDLSEVTFMGSDATSIIVTVLGIIATPMTCKLITTPVNGAVLAMLDVDKMVDCFTCR